MISPLRALTQSVASFVVPAVVVEMMISPLQVDMEELDLTAAESKATYEEIQEWVQEKYGFHVTHLNIAKTKRKCGIIERQNYNLPKSENSRSPETPKEKEEAIIDAFLHFKMM